MNKFLKVLGVIAIVGLVSISVVGCKGNKNKDNLPPMDNGEEIYIDSNDTGIDGGENGGWVDDAGDNSLDQIATNSGGANGNDDLTIIDGLNFPIIYFPYDSNEIVGSELPKIDRVANYMNKYSDLFLIIEGHCDQRGTEEYNRPLGERRANMIKESLVNAGVAPDRIRTISYGKDRPVVDGDGEGVWGKNRRGELLPAKKR